MRFHSLNSRQEWVGIKHPPWPFAFSVLKCRMSFHCRTCFFHDIIVIHLQFRYQMASKSPERVQRLISCTQKPLVFHGLIDSWPMLKFTQSDWNNLFGETLLECRVGNRGLNGDLPQWEGRCENIKCTFSQLIKWSNHRDDGTNAELSDLEANNHFLYYGYKYMKDIFETEVLRMTDWKAFGYPDRNGAESTFWLGTAGAHTPCHYDTYGCNLVAQLSGRKRWILYSPDETEFLKPTRVPYEESSVYSQINFEQWSNTAPIIEGTHPYVVELSPGDVLFVPRHWWHYVRNEELSISINTWLELPDQDSEARLHESLVKFLVAHTTRNLPPNVVSDLLNPNEVRSKIIYKAIGSVLYFHFIFSFNRKTWLT